MTNGMARTGVAAAEAVSMNLRWLVGNFSDPDFKLTRAQQREVTRLAHRKHLRRSTLLVWTAGMCIAGWLVVGFGWELFAGVLARAGIQPALPISGLAIVLAVSVVAAWLYRFIYVKPVRLAMRDMGHDVCIGCGYRLTGLNAEIVQCPECGRVRLPMPMTPSATDTHTHSC